MSSSTSPSSAPSSISTLSASRTVLHSSDHVRLLADYLSFNDLIQASSLSRSVHSALNSESVWLSRLPPADDNEQEAVETERDDDRERFIGGGRVDRADILPPAVLAALPPLPSLAEAAALCLNAYMLKHQQRLRGYQTRVTAVVRLPSTLVYHVKIITGLAAVVLKHTVSYLAFTLRYSASQRAWLVQSWVDHLLGWWAVNVENIAEDDLHYDEDTMLWQAATKGEDASGDTIPASVDEDGSQGLLPRASAAGLAGTSTPPTTAISSKQRYIDLHKCSEHEHNHCYRLLPASIPRPHMRTKFLKVPRSCDLPLCASCRALIAACIEHTTILGRRGDRPSHTVGSVCRVNAVEYDTALYTLSGWSLVTRVRLRIAYNTRTDNEADTDETDEKRGSGTVVDGRYMVVAHYGGKSCPFVTSYNVCTGCRRGLAKSGLGHMHGCIRADEKS